MINWLAAEAPLEAGWLAGSLRLNSIEASMPADFSLADISFWVAGARSLALLNSLASCCGWAPD